MPDLVLERGSTGREVGGGSREARSRLIDAITRASTECGYPAVDVERIARYARVPVETFHEHFGSKDECLFAAFSRFLDRLLIHMAEECEAARDWPEEIKMAIEAGFDFIAELEAQSRLFVVDAKLAGPAAIELTTNSIGRAADYLKHGRVRYPRCAGMPEATEQTLVSGVVMIASVHLLAEEAHLLPDLAAEVVEMVLTPYLGSRRANQVATS